MTDEEIKAVVTDTPSAFKRTEPPAAAAAPAPMTASEAAWEAVQRLGTSAIVEGLRREELAQVETPTPLADAFEKAAEKARSDAAGKPSKAERDTIGEFGRAFREGFRQGLGLDPVPEPEPVVAVVHMGDSEAHARSYNEGYEDGYNAGQSAVITDDSTDALITWLKTYGPGWSQAEAERWFRALTATIDLIYPTRGEGAA